MDRQGSAEWGIRCCAAVLALGICAVVTIGALSVFLLPGLLAELSATPMPPPTGGPAVYLIQESDLPAGAKLSQYQEVPHPQCTDYAVLFQMPNGLQAYDKVCCSTSPVGVADLSTAWPDTVRVAAPTVGEKSMTFHGPVMGRPSVTITFVQGQCEGMIQVIGSDDAAATDLAVSLARTAAARVPRTALPTPSATEQAECCKSIELSVSNREFGPPTTVFSTSDGVFPMVTNGVDCGPAGVRLIDPNGKTAMERTFGVAAGSTGYGDYNAAKNLAPGVYKMELWYGDKLLKTIQVTVR